MNEHHPSLPERIIYSIFCEQVQITSFSIAPNSALVEAQSLFCTMPRIGDVFGDANVEYNVMKDPEPDASADLPPPPDEGDGDSTEDLVATLVGELWKRAALAIEENVSPWMSTDVTEYVSRPVLWVLFVLAILCTFVQAWRTVRFAQLKKKTC